MESLRAPDECFANLGDSPFAPKRPFAAFQKGVCGAPGWERCQMLRPMVPADLPQAGVGGLRAPYLDPMYLVGNRPFTPLLATTPDDPQLPDNRAAMQLIRTFDRPPVMIYRDKDRVALGTKGAPHVTLNGESHSLQEDILKEYAERRVRWLESLR